MVNYSKPTCGLVHFNIAYQWFKMCHFTHLRFKTLVAITHLAQFPLKKQVEYKSNLSNLFLGF